MTFKNVWRLSNYWKKKNLQVLWRETRKTNWDEGFFNLGSLFPRHLVFWRFSRPTTNLECIGEAFDAPLQHFEEDTWIVDWGETCFCSRGPRQPKHHWRLMHLLRRQHRQKASITVTTLFSVFILLPFDIKLASESVCQLYRTSPEACSYLDCLEHCAQPTVQFCQYIMSTATKATSDIGDIGGVVGGVVNPKSPHPSSQPSPASPPQPLGPLDSIRKHNIKMFSAFHIKRDATYLAPPSVDIKDIYNQSFTPILDPNLDTFEAIGKYFRACPHHQSDQKNAYFVLYDDEFRYLESHNKIQLTNVDPLLQAGYPSLYQHIHLHQQTTDTINFRITSSLLLGANDKIEGQLQGRVPTTTAPPETTSWPSGSRQMSLGQSTSYIHTEGGHHNIKTLSSTSLQPYNRCTSVRLGTSWASSKGRQASTFSRKRTTHRSAAHICLIKHPSVDLSTATFTASWTSSTRNHLEQGTSSHQCLLPSRDAHRQVARAGSTDIREDNDGYIRFEYIDIDNQHHPLKTNHHHRQVQWRHQNEPVSYLVDINGTINIFADIWGQSLTSLSIFAVYRLRVERTSETSHQEGVWKLHPGDVRFLTSRLPASIPQSKHPVTFWFKDTEANIRHNDYNYHIHEGKHQGQGLIEKNDDMHDDPCFFCEKSGALPKFSKENPPKNTDFVKTSQKCVDPCYLQFVFPGFCPKNPGIRPPKSEDLAGPK